MKLFVAVTDRDWFEHLRAVPDLEEANFWQPSGRSAFRALTPGEPLLFKLHYPDNFIVGGGLFAHYSLLPVSLAWEAFGAANGAATLEEMRQRIEQYRRESDRTADYQIGCVVLQQPFFFSEDMWIRPPDSFVRNIVRGKGYDTATEEGDALWREVELRLLSSQPEQWQEAATLGAYAMVRRRLGQGAFRVLVTDAYERRCAVTGERILPVLQAAHIKPVKVGGLHRVDNGLLLRSDVHRLYDLGYMTVTPDHRFRVSPRLKSEFANGEHYRQFAEQEIFLPRDAEERPSAEALEWHSDTVFLAS